MTTTEHEPLDVGYHNSIAWGRDPDARGRVRRFLVRSGEVRSAEDGDLHHVSSRHLMGLYGVDPQECIVIERDRMSHRGYDQAYLASLLELKPSQAGVYLRVGPAERRAYPTPPTA